VEKVLVLEGGELTGHNMAVIWPSYPKPNKKTKHWQPNTKEVELSVAKEEEDRDKIVIALARRQMKRTRSGLRARMSKGVWLEVLGRWRS